MECVIFIGIQASGKSTFYKQRFFNTHIRINLDMLKTRYRENILVTACVEGKQPFVVDNTNPTSEERVKYIESAKHSGFKVTGYYFEPCYEESIIRNDERGGKEKVPQVAIKSTISKLQKPVIEEGFDELYKVRLVEGEFRVEEIC
ncbi:ATP-binding protein [Paenibacillus sp. HWE-109]|uniref:AAA family ATPase n=1 Tax=Paenibacillus sp. HWE-109 TaxID=1306526 RepID=UPI001EDD5FB5|nr:AAA family ATPase [Paenibacillus sp. HWE-109]UKS28421.1 ATP-binding protein [Paenibacillus sp. HWE-109]